MRKKLNILALLGERKSDNNQIMAIASMLANGGVVYKKKVFFNFLIKLPNILSFLLPVWLTIKKSDNFTDIERCDVIVTCGRRSIRYAKHLKQNFTGAKLIQILHPEHSLKDIDLVLYPEHDEKYTKESKKKLLTFKGAIINNFEQQEVESSVNFYKEKIENLKSPLISVFVGGSSRHFHFKKELIAEFTRRLNEVAKQMNATLLITTSRRTDKDFVRYVKKNLFCDFFLFDYSDKRNQHNPFFAFLYYGDYLISTGDSISMISELLSAEKPLYIYLDGIKSKKYNNFHNTAIQDGMCKEFSRNIKFLEKFNTKKLNNLEEISEKIYSKIISD
jgi:mitochondrial fission protein ELM1